MKPTGYEFTVVIAHCPVLPGRHSTDVTDEEARRGIADAVRRHVNDLRERGEPIPHEVATTRVHVSA